MVNGQVHSEKRLMLTTAGHIVERTNAYTRTTVWSLVDSDEVAGFRGSPSYTILSQASAHGRLQLTQEKLWVGAYKEEPFELLSYHCVRAHPALTCTASATTMKPLKRMHALTPCKASVVLHRKPSLCMAS